MIDDLPGRTTVALKDLLAGGDFEAEIHGHLYSLAKAQRDIRYVQVEIQKRLHERCLSQ